MRRTVGIAAGIVTHVLFAVTVCFLYQFLQGGHIATADGDLRIDLVLALQFAVLHSALLYPRVRQAMTRWIAAPFYGLFFCATTCAGLLILFKLWQPSTTVWWQLTGGARRLIDLGWFGSWAGLIYSLSLNGFGYQTGWTPWWRWVRRQPPLSRPFQPRGAYYVLRHPVYLCFLGLVWFTPLMTPDRALLTAVWTAYVFVGSCLKDQRLAYYVGEDYLNYQARVAGYPGMFFGPLGKIALVKSPRMGVVAVEFSPMSVASNSPPQFPPGAESARATHSAVRLSCSSSR